MDAVILISWICQVYLAFFFLRSAYRKTIHFTRVADEFKRWGYPFPGQVTIFLVGMWIFAGSSLLIPPLAASAALLLLLFMLVAFATLLVHGEIRRLVEPGVPIVLLTVVIALRFDELMNVIQLFKDR